MILICALLAVLLTAASACAAATTPIVASMELSPAYLTSPGKINVSITVSNATNEDLKDAVILYDPAAQPVTDFGTNGEAMLKAGETLTWTGSYDVNQNTLDNGSISYFIKYTNYMDSGEAIEQSMPVMAKISKEAMSTLLEVKRTISPGVAREGQKVAVDYHITNAGTDSLTDIEIAENSDINAEVQKIPELKSGQTADISYPVTMGTKNLISGATITYMSQGTGEKQTYVVEDQTIAYGNSDITAKLTASSKGTVVNGIITLTLDLKNGGSVDFSDIRVTDPVLGEVFTNQQLAAGKSLSLKKEITLTETTTYQFSITAIDSTGTESATGTDAVTVSAVAPEDALNLTMTASADETEAYGDPAIVRFTLNISNDSNVAANKVAISHGDTAIYTFDTIPAGESRTMNRDMALSNSGKYQFTAVAQDPLENTMTFKSNELQIAVYAPTPVPQTPTPAPNPTPEPTFVPATIIPIRDASIGATPKLIQNVLLPVLILLGVLLIASCVLLIIATKRRGDQKKASEAAYDHLERAKRRDYVTPAEDETPEAAAEGEDSAPEGDKPASDKKGKKKKLTKEEQEAQMANRRLVGEPKDEPIENWELPHVKYARDAADSQTEEEGFSAMSQGLYDEELTSGFGDELEKTDDVMYEQPYADTFTEDDASLADTENDGYTEELPDTYAVEDVLPADDAYDQTLYGDPADDAGEAPRYDDEVYDEAAEPNDGSFGDIYEDGYGTEDAGFADDEPSEGAPAAEPHEGRRRSRQSRSSDNGLN